MLQNKYSRTLFPFLGGALLASSIVLVFRTFPNASVPVSHASVASAATTGTPPIRVSSAVPARADQPVSTAEQTEPAAQPTQALAPIQDLTASAQPAPEVSTESGASGGPCPCPEPAPAATPDPAPFVPAPEPAPVVTVEKPITKIQVVKSVVLGPGTPVFVRLNESLATGRNHSGDHFQGILQQPIVIDGFLAAERGARVEGRIVHAEPASRFRGLARMSVVLTSINTADGQELALLSYPIDVEGRNIVGVQSLKTGASTSVGAVVGAVAGKEPGSALGSVVGGVIGTSGAILTGGKPAVLSPEQTLNFRLRAPVTITEHASSESE